MKTTTKTKPWFAHPALSVLLGVAWLLLQHTLELFHLVSAVVIGVLVPRILHDFLPVTRLSNLPVALRLSGTVLRDIVVSNVVVARLVLGPMSRPRPAWVPVPLTLTDPTGIALLATIITTTPGTVSCNIDEEQRLILVHALDCDDPAQMAADIKVRYEAPLLKIFEAHSRGVRQGDHA